MTTPPGPDVTVVLVAEDETPVRQMVDLVLRSAGHRTVLCADGEEAIAALDTEPRLDGALLDLRMPRRDGLDVIRAIRAHPRWAELPVLAMSAYSDEPQAREVVELGADGFLPKPFTVHELTSAIAVAIGRQDADG